VISPECIALYRGPALKSGERFLYIPPHKLLRPYISNYTVTFPSQQSMPDAYTVLPSASATMVIAASSSGFVSSLRGVDTRASRVGDHANKMKLLLLIEFMPGGLHPFIPADQAELLDASFSLFDLDKGLKKAIENELDKVGSIDALGQALDGIFLSRLLRLGGENCVSAMMRHIAGRHGAVSARELSQMFFYSEKQIRRLFARSVGVGPKTFSRIVRVNHALRFLEDGPQKIADAAIQAGFFDQPHLNHDLREICGLTPQAYLQNMSVFYNDRFKI
jgi:AraC-like DNA-binding protein